ncbi:hypothetical protein [Novosphingobium sp.]|uniref:hypothetical protein n=1 Tax=Novosphingobium sp. TaxID=1874826 RepID=UPI00286E2828|nr:hypothetical protein [Novosphingobium sp.]
MKQALRNVDINDQNGDANIKDVKYAQYQSEAFYASWHTAFGPRMRLEPNHLQALKVVSKRLKALNENQRFISIAGKAKFNRHQKNVKKFEVLPGALNSSNSTVVDVAKAIDESIDAFLLKEADLTFPDGAKFQAFVDALPAIVPSAQGMGPVQFEISDGGVLVLRSQTTHDLDIENPELLAEKSAILTSGSHLINELHRTNCDKIVITILQTIQDSLANNSHPVRIGLLNKTFGEFHNEMQGEVSDDIFSSAKMHFDLITSYVSKFSDWQNFDNLVDATELTQDNAIALSSSLLVAADQLATTKFAAPEVPRTLMFLRSLLVDQRFSSKHAIFAACVTMENLIIVGMKFLIKTCKDTVKLTVKISSRGVACVLAARILTSAMELAGVKEITDHIGWLGKLFDLFRTSIS